MSLPSIARPLTVDTYTTTHEFRSIDRHTAVCLDDELRGLVAVCGPAGDARSEATASLFAAAPELLEQLELALRWLDNAMGEAELELTHKSLAFMDKREREFRLAQIREHGPDVDRKLWADWVRRVFEGMPNNWTGRIAMRAAIAKARGTP